MSTHSIDQDIEAFLPLRAVELQILVSLGGGVRHGYAIIQDAEERGEGQAVPGLATLYRALRRLEGEGLIEHAEEDEEDERRRPYRLTDLGRRVAAAEVRRLSRLLQDAARGHLAPGAAD